MYKLFLKNILIKFDKNVEMKNLVKLTVICILLISTFTNAQEKVKGNKIVTTEDRNISEFTRIEVIDNLDVLLVYNENQSVVIEADSNLHNAIITEVNNGVLILKTDAKIIRKKELKIHLTVNKKLKEINAHNKASVKSKNSLIIDSLIVNAFDNSNFDLKLNSKNLSLKGNKTSNLKFEIVCDEVLIRAVEYCDLKATIDTKYTNITLLDKATISFEGTTDDLDIECYGNSTFKGKSFVSKKALINTTNSSKAYVNAKDKIDIYAKNSAEVFLFSNPKISLPEFFDKASLHKRQ